MPIICLDARHAKAALSLRVNKTDANDAHGIAQIICVGWYREVAVKSMDNHVLRAMLSARAQLVAQTVTVANTIRGLLRVFGVVVRKAKGRRFEGLVRAAIIDQLMLTRFRGHPSICVRGVHHVEIGTTLPT